MGEPFGPQARSRPGLFEQGDGSPLQHAGPDFCWFHPRVAAIPNRGANGKPRVVMTLCQHLDADDHYSGLFYMYTDDLGLTWKGPFEVKHLAAQPEPGGLHSSVHDVTPGWHAPTQRLLAIGCQVPYSPNGAQIVSGLPSRQHQTGYAVHDPRTGNFVIDQSLTRNAGTAGDGTLTLKAADSITAAGTPVISAATSGATGKLHTILWSDAEAAPNNDGYISLANMTITKIGRAHV